MPELDTAAEPGTGVADGGEAAEAAAAEGLAVRPAVTAKAAGRAEAAGPGAASGAQAAPTEARAVEPADAGAVTPAETGASEVPEPEADPLPWQPIVSRWRLPIAAATLLLEADVLLRLGLHWSTLPVLAFGATAVILAVVDFAILRLPNALTGLSALAVSTALVVDALADREPHKLLTELEGAVGVGVFYLLLYALSRGGLGEGDVKVGAVAGMLLASRDWIHVFDGTFLAYVITLVIALAMLTRGRKHFPYGPGLIAGALAVLLLAP